MAGSEDPRAAHAGPPEQEPARIARALGHPARIRILRLLMEREACIGCDIVDEIGLAQSTVSEHLRILKSAGIVVGEIERPRVCYTLNPDALRPLATLLGAAIARDGPPLSRRAGSPAASPLPQRA